MVMIGRWVRWTPREEDYLRDHAEDSNQSIATILNRGSSAVRRKRYALGLLLPAERNLANRRAARARGKDIWPIAQKRILEDHGPHFLDTYGPECDKNLKRLVDAVGPARTLQAIQLMRSALGIVETIDARKRRLRRAAALIDYGKRRQISPEMTWKDLSSIQQRLWIASTLGDGAELEANGTHYYSETHKLAHKEYLRWKIDMMPPEFRGNWREDRPEEKDPKCVWETGVSKIFTMLREHFYLDSKRGFNTIISHWVIEQINLFVLLIWLLDDGTNQSKDNGFPNLSISVPAWDREHLQQVCKVINAKYRLNLRVIPRTPKLGVVNNIVIPAADRDYLIPIWHEYARQYELPECMNYKFPAYIVPTNKGRRLNWELTFGKDVNGLRTIVLNTERVALAGTALTMHRNGTSLKAIGEFLAAKGHPITPRYLRGVWERLSNGQG